MKILFRYSNILDILNWNYSSVFSLQSSLLPTKLSKRLSGLWVYFWLLIVFVLISVCTTFGTKSESVRMTCKVLQINTIVVHNIKWSCTYLQLSPNTHVLESLSESSQTRRQVPVNTEELTHREREWEWSRWERAQLVTITWIIRLRSYSSVCRMTQNNMG